MVDVYIELICDVLHDPLLCSWGRYYSYMVAMETTFVSCWYNKIHYISTHSNSHFIFPFDHFQTCCYFIKDGDGIYEKQENCTIQDLQFWFVF